MKTKFAKSAYLNFLLWGVCSSMGVTVSTIVDAILVGNFIGSNGLAVANIATPVFLAYALLGLTIGVGANMLIGRWLGASDVEAANRVFHKQLFAGVAAGLLCMVLAVLFRDVLCQWLGGKGGLFHLSRQYLTVVFVSAPVFVLYHIFSLSVRTDGAPRLAACASAVVIAVNLSLDLLFMKVLNWGIVGASASLCIAEALGLAVLLLHFLNPLALLKLKIAVPGWNELRDFVANGFGVGSAQIFQAAIMLVFNTLLLDSPDGVFYVAVFSVIYTISTIPQAVFDGAGSALSTVVPIFAGERDTESILTVLRQGLKLAGLSGALLALAFFQWAEELVGCFGLNGDKMEYAVLAVRIYAVSVLLTGINSLAVAFWQAAGRARLAGFMSLARNFILMLILGTALIGPYQLLGLGLTYLCTEVLCLIGVAGVAIFRSSKAYLQGKYPPSDRVFERYYTIQTESTAQISDDLQRLCEEWNVGANHAFFINLMVEELLLNIIKFGLRESRKQRYIAVRVMDNNGEYILRIRDNVNTYNPFDSEGDEIDNAVIRMIQTKSKYCDYQRKLIFNYLYLIL